MSKQKTESLGLDTTTGEIQEVQGVYYVDGLPVYDKCNLMDNDHLGYDEYKNVVVVHEAPTDIWKEMNIEAQQTGLRNVLAMVIRNGQSLAVLDYDDTQCVDTTLVPDNINDQLAQQKAMKEAFDKIPASITEGKNIQDFLAMLGNQDVMDFIKKQTEKNNLKEISTNEQKQD